MSRSAEVLHPVVTLLAITVAFTACSPGTADPPSPTTEPTTSVTSLASIDTGDITGFPTATITFDGRELLVAVADTPGRRSRGLREVKEFGDLSGMLFRFGGPVTAVFTMQDTPTPLDLFLLDADGTVLEVLAMDPCSGSECRFPPTVVYHYALEAPRTSLDASIGDRLMLP